RRLTSTESSASAAESCSSAGEPIKKSAREFIIPIAVEGKGYVTPRQRSLEPEPQARRPRQPKPRRIRSSRAARAESVSSGEEDEEDEGFHLLTAENLFSTLLHRVIVRNPVNSKARVGPRRIGAGRSWTSARYSCRSARRARCPASRPRSRAVCSASCWPSCRPPPPESCAARSRCTRPPPPRPAAPSPAPPPKEDAQQPAKEDAPSSPQYSTLPRLARRSRDPSPPREEQPRARGTPERPLLSKYLTPERALSLDDSCSSDSGSLLAELYGPLGPAASPCAP
ncbi:hypothetical protein MSG28_007302, partial [Choristoneura fumiferana]